MYNLIIKMPRYTKVATVLIIDTIFILFSYFVALILRLNEVWPLELFIRSLNLIYIAIAATVFITFILQLHLKQIRSFNFSNSLSLVLLVISITCISFSANILLKLDVPRTVPLIAGIILIVWLFAFRIFCIYLLNILKNSNKNRIHVAIYGAGSTGTQLATTLGSSAEYRPMIFVDENRYLQNLFIAGLRVIKPTDLEKFVKRKNIQEVFLAISSLTTDQRKRIINSISLVGCKVSEIPSYKEIIKSGSLLKSLKSFESEKLLGRESVKLETAISVNIYKDTNILVSGGGGSIGAELCRQIIRMGPKCLVVLDTSEISLFNIENELKPICNKQGINLIIVLGSVCDEQFLNKLFQEQNIKIVLHAAAYKHVPLVEKNIIQGIKNNVFGTKTIAEAAIINGVERFTLISSDKAVRPTSVMGATKRMAELILQDLDSKQGECTFAMVRFGNVLGSSGSVIPLFKKQLQKGGPITVTHPEMTRYFMMISEAAILVLSASSLATGGEVFVLDMGNQIKIIDLAKRLVELSGLTIKDEQNPEGEIEIVLGGIREGEKVYEENYISDNTVLTDHPKILCTKETRISSEKLQSACDELEKYILTQNSSEAKNILFNTIIT